ncbi:MAG: amidohydrolase family protein [Myxococcaceae bacterium]|nr:amidohydrolase family protein [Myxococcaceae bacterium]
MEHDLALMGGTLFDGTGAPGRVTNVAVRDGAVAAIGDEPFRARQVVDARGLWVMPGFLDVHTHYDAEVEAAPSLSESLIHGVTTIFMGSCSLGAVLSDPVDIADMYTRVEAMPREHVLPLFEQKKTWRSPREYREHLSTLALGPNVACFMGHSDLRCAAMGLERSVTTGEEPTTDELARMRAWLADGLDAGFLGLSCNTNTWDKLGGSRFRSRPLPSTYANWEEIRALTAVVRERGRVLQGIPNISAKYDTFLFFLESMGLGFRPAVKTSLVSMVDVRSNRLIYKALGLISRIVNRVLGGDVRFQALPVQFDLFVDGLDAPVFEELGAGTAALHLEKAHERRALLLEPKYRRWFRRQWTSAFAPKVFHRDFKQSQVVSCPDASLVGRSFVDIAQARGGDVVEVFLDLVAEHGEALRWRTVIGNDRPHAVREIMAHPDTQPGFSDAGAHLKNMAFYNFPLFLLRLAARDGAMPVERAVHRLTGEIADWYGLDAGRVEPGARADLAVIDPKGLDASLDDIHEGSMPELGNWLRLVRRNPGAVPYVLVNGRIAAERGELRDTGHGRFLAAGEPAREQKAPLRAAA